MNIILRELNPVYDLSRHSEQSNLKDYAIFGLNLYKSLVRGNIAGGIVGSTLGAITGFVLGKDLPQHTLDGLLIGMLTGTALDQTQYCCRYIRYRIQHSVIHPLQERLKNHPQ